MGHFLIFGQFFPVFGFRPVFHSMPGGLTCNPNPVIACVDLLDLGWAVPSFLPSPFDFAGSFKASPRRRWACSSVAALQMCRPECTKCRNFSAIATAISSRVKSCAANLKAVGKRGRSESFSTGVWCVPGAWRGFFALECSKLQKEGENPGKGHFYFLRQTLVCTKPWFKRDLDRQTSR